MGFTEWRRESNLPAKAVKALQNGEDQIEGIASSSALTSNSVGLHYRGAAAQIVKESSGVVETALMDADENLGKPLLNLRELRCLDQALQTVRGELTNNLAKLTEMDEHIAIEKRKLGWRR